jgi:hypothetical protein
MCDEHEHFISLGFDGHSVIYIYGIRIYWKISKLKPHNFDNLKYLPVCNQSTDFDESDIKLIREFYFITLATQIAQ